MRVLLLPLLLSVAWTASTLHYVAEITRHGARTPTSSEFDPYNTPYGVLRAGDLTAVGERQHYLLGREWNRRYNAENGTVGRLYNDTYATYEVYIRSSNVPRTLASANAQLEGLFPPGKRANLTAAQALNARPPFPFNISSWQDLGQLVLPLNYQAAPVQAYDQSVDPYLDNWCPGFQRAVEAIKAGKNYTDL